MQAYFNEPGIKEMYLARMTEHMRLDHLVQGIGWKGDGAIKGCAIGCILNKYDHAAFETELNMPEWLSHLVDRIHEGLDWKYANTWPYDFLDAAHVGADLNQIKIPFLIIVCESVLEYVTEARFAQQRDVIAAVIVELKKPVIDVELLKNAAYAAGYAAYTAYAAADAAYVDDAAGYAAVGTAYAADAAADAAYANNTVYEYYSIKATAKADKYKYFADELLKLIRGCKPITGD